jgi:hypothetical protein
MSRIDSWYRKISTGRHFQNGHHNIAQIQHCSISTKFHMLVDYDVRNWFPTLWNFYRSPFSKWPPQCHKKSSSEFVTMQSVHLNLLSVAGLGDFIIVRLKSYLVLFVFLLGSMGGDNILNATQTLMLLVKTLRVGCYFNVVSFGSHFSKLFQT